MRISNYVHFKVWDEFNYPFQTSTVEPSKLRNGQVISSKGPKPYILWGVSALYTASLIARFMGPTWGPFGADRTQVGPMWAPWTLLSGMAFWFPLATHPWVPRMGKLRFAQSVWTESARNRHRWIWNFPCKFKQIIWYMMCGTLNREWRNRITGTS